MTSKEVSLGTIIYTSVKPFFKIYAILGCGFYLGRKDVISPIFTKSLSDLVINVLFPCLVFSKIIAELKSSNIREIGIIAFVSVLYFGMGGLGGVASYYLGGKPKYWKGGSISVGILPNISDLPIAFLTTFAGGLLFDSEQGEKGIAYICIFTFFQILIQFNFGIFKLIGYDYHQQNREEGEDLKEFDNQVQDEESSGTTQGDVQPPKDPQSDHSQLTINTLDSISTETSAPSQTQLAPSAYVTNSASVSASVSIADNVINNNDNTSIESLAVEPTHITRIHTNVSRQLSRQVSILSNTIGAPTHNTNQLVKVYSHQVVNASNNSIEFDSISIHPKQPSTQNIGMKSLNYVPTHIKTFLLFMLDNLKRPVSAALLSAIIIAMIPWVRAIFVKSTQVKIHPAPDSLPPLSFIMDTATYLGSAAVPCGLLLLGATLSRLNIGQMPKYFWVTPLLLSFLRLILMPIVGCLIVWGLKKAHWFDGDDMLLFVCLIVWGVPNATSIIYISAYYAPVEPELQVKYKQLNYLSLCYAIQYSVLFITLPFLCVFCVTVILGY